MNTPTPYSHYLEGLVASLDEFHRNVQACYQSSFYNTLTIDDFNLMIIDHEYLMWDSANSNPPTAANSLMDCFTSVEANIIQLTHSFFKTMDDWEDIKTFLNNFAGCPYSIYNIQVDNSIVHNGICYNYVSYYFVSKTEGRFPKSLVLKRNIVLVDLNKSPLYKVA